MASYLAIITLQQSPIALKRFWLHARRVLNPLTTRRRGCPSGGAQPQQSNAVHTIEEINNSFTLKYRKAIRSLAFAVYLKDLIDRPTD
uniref:Uncharacterized protein n=1 Tax=Glossina pallidipes TaxID=7398 RepID=A0A1A9ZRP9_GLOPL